MTMKRAAKKFLTGVRPKRAASSKKPAITILDKGEVENIIREQAYKLYEQRGCTHGSDIDDWVQAERIVTKI